MHDNKEGRSFRDNSGGRCYCGDCIEWGCSCADTGRHDGCLCGVCGIGPDDYEPAVRYPEGEGHD